MEQKGLRPSAQLRRVTLDEQFVEDIDRLVSEHVFQNRNQAIQEAVEDKLKRIKRTRLAKECTKLDIPFEKTMAEEGFAEDLNQWPEY